MKNPTGITANCASCMLSSIQDLNGNILCRIHGITSYNYYCNRYKPKTVVSKPSNMRDIFLTCNKCKYYDTEKSMQPDLGVCQYYKFRPFQGDKRKACSNFIEKSSSNDPFVYNSNASLSRNSVIKYTEYTDESKYLEK